MNWFRRKPLTETEINISDVNCPKCSHLYFHHLDTYCAYIKSRTATDPEGFKRVIEEHNTCKCDLSRVEILLNLNIERKYQRGRWDDYSYYVKRINK